MYRTEGFVVSVNQNENQRKRKERQVLRPCQRTKIYGT